MVLPARSILSLGELAKLSLGESTRVSALTVLACLTKPAPREANIVIRPRIENFSVENERRLLNITSSDKNNRNEGALQSLRES